MMWGFAGGREGGMSMGAVGSVGSGGLFWVLGGIFVNVCFFGTVRSQFYVFEEFKKKFLLS